MDTIIFALNNLKDSYPLLNTMARTEKGKWFVEAKLDHDGERRSVKAWMLDYGNDITIPIRYSDKKNIPSSNHDIPYTIDEINNYLEVNVSVPKVMFGNNVCEAVIPPGHKDYSVNNTSPMHQVDYWYNLIRYTINRTLHQISHGNNIDLNWYDVEVKRLDLAINQHHESCEELLRYLEHQKRLKKKHSREYGSSNVGIYKTAITYKTKRSYGKIYHKGSEFRDVQAKKIIKINEDRKKLGKTLRSSNLEYAATHIQDMQLYSDKILRYELEFKKDYMSYLYNRFVHKQWSKRWREAVRIFDYCDFHKDFARDMWRSETWYINDIGQMSKEKPYLIRARRFFFRRYDDITKKVELVGFNQREAEIFIMLKTWNLFNNYRGFKRWMKYMTKELNKARSFRISLPPGKVDWSKNTAKNADGFEIVLTPFGDYPNGTSADVRFTKTLLEVMTEDLMRFYRQFQVVTKNTTEEFIDKMAYYNREVDKKICIAEGVSAISLIGPGKEASIKKRLLKLRLAAGWLSPRQQRTLLEFNVMHAKKTEKELIGRHYSRSSYYAIKKKYQALTGQKEHIAAAHFSNVIQRNPAKIYEKLYSDINYSFLTNFYNLGMQHFGIVKMAI